MRVVGYDILGCLVHHERREERVGDRRIRVLQQEISPRKSLPFAYGDSLHLALLEHGESGVGGLLPHPRPGDLDEL